MRHVLTLVFALVCAGAHTTTADPVVTTRVSHVKTSADGTAIELRDAVVTADFGDCFYVEQKDRSCGIRVRTAMMPPMPPDFAGSVVNLSGSPATWDNGERYLECTNVAFTGSRWEIRPVCMTTNDLGGDRLGHQEGISIFYYLDSADGVPRYHWNDSRGINNLGLLVTICGKVTVAGRSGGWFYVDDGVKIQDGTGALGICVWADWLAPPAVGSMVSVTGVSSCERYQGVLVSLLRPRSSSDVKVISTP